MKCFTCQNEIVNNPSYKKEGAVIINRLTQELGEHPTPLQMHNAVLDIKKHIKWQHKLGGPEYHFCSRRCSDAFHDKNVEEAGRKMVEGCESVECPSCGGLWWHEPDCDLTDFQRENL